ncbi:MAG: hypothetical protein KDK70_08380 [Myxococcales bacterium]|nr:hypothetical protein [Myxococcales bacterium]
MNKTTKITALAGLTALAAWGLGHAYDAIVPLDTCVTSATVVPTINGSNEITVSVTDSSGNTLPGCGSLEEGNTCTIYISSSTSSITVTFNQQNGQFASYYASGTTLFSFGSLRFSNGNYVNFTVVGAQNSDVFFEGDPTIQVQVGNCG